MAEVKVLGGSMPKHKCQYSFGSISLWDGKGSNWGLQTISVADTFESLELVTEQNRVNFTGASGWGAVGTVLAGPAGLIVGGLLGGRGKKIAFVARLKDGRQFVGETTAKTYAKMLTQISVAAAANPEPLIRACPYCAEDIKVQAIKCKHCGSDVQSSSKPVLSERDMNCGTCKRVTIHRHEVGGKYASIAICSVCSAAQRF